MGAKIGMPKGRGMRFRISAALVALMMASAVLVVAQASPEAKGVRTVGVVKAIGNGTLTVTADTGERVTATLQPETKIIRVAPGQKDLKEATPLKVDDLQVGDRVLVRGLPISGGQSLTAAVVIVMKQADVANKQAQEREDWQKRGVGGLVTAVDPTASTITISLGPGTGGTPPKTLLIHTTKSTTLRRYAANSIKFDDAKPAPFTEIKPGDQLRARGDKSADENELTAEEVISGSFRNIAGTILAKDASGSTITVQDVLSKKPITVRLAPDSTTKALPPEIAQRIAVRLKGGASGGGGNGGGAPAHQGSGGSPGGPGGGAPDLQRFLSRLPDKGLSDLNKGDAVMIVATEGGDGKPVTAITLLAGVEPILTAAPNGSLSSWTLGSSIGGEGGPQ
jgi:Domain of unknown function (DUF5666)